MAKFNIFNSFKKEESNKPSDLQRKIDEKEESIRKFEDEIQHAGDVLLEVESNQNEEIKSRKKQIAALKKEVNNELDDLSVKKEDLNETIEKFETKSVKASKNASKTKATQLSKMEAKNQIYKEKVALKEEKINAEIQSLKQKEDKVFIEKRKELKNKVDKIKSDLNETIAAESEKRKGEIDKLESELVKKKKKFQSEILAFENKLSIAVKNKEITKDTYQQEISNLKNMQAAELESKKAELQTKINSWKSTYDDFALTSKEFIEAKKSEYNLLVSHEKNLKDLLKQKQNKVDLERKNLEKEHQLKLKELENTENEIKNQLISAQNEYKIMSESYLKEAENYAHLREVEKQQNEELIVQLNSEFEQLQQDYSVKIAGLDNRLKDESDKIYKFYSDLLSNETSRLNNEIDFINEEMRRDEEKFLLTKNELEGKKNSADSNFYQRLNEVKDKIIATELEIKNSQSEHEESLKILAEQFENEKQNQSEIVEQKRKEYEVMKAQLEEDIEKHKGEIIKQKETISSLKEQNKNELLRLDEKIEEIRNLHKATLTDKVNMIEDLRLNLQELQDKSLDLETIRNDERVKHEENILEFEDKREQIVSEHQVKLDYAKEKFKLKIKAFEEKVLSKKSEFEEKFNEDMNNVNVAHEKRLEEFKVNREKLMDEHASILGGMTKKLEQLEHEHTNALEHEKNVLASTIEKYEETVRNHASEIEKINLHNKSKIDELKNDTEKKIKDFFDKMNEFSSKTNHRIEKIRSEINELSLQEKNIIEEMSLAQQEFESNKNNLVRNTSAELEKHLETINNFEHNIEEKRAEIRVATEELTNIVAHYEKSEREESLKLEKLKESLSTELIEQNEEIEKLIVELELHKDQRIESIRSEFEKTRKAATAQLNNQISDMQLNFENDKRQLVKEQEAYEDSANLKIKENNNALSEIKDQIKQYTALIEQFDKEHKKELTQLLNDFENRKMQLEYEYELANDKNVKEYEKFRAELEEQLNQENIKKIQLTSAVETKIQMQENKKKMIDKFIEDYEQNKRIRLEDRNREIQNYQESINQLDSNIHDLQEELEATRNENNLKIQEIMNTQIGVENEIKQIIENRKDNFAKHVDSVKENHEKEVNGFIAAQDEQQSIFTKQNEAIIHNFTMELEEYKKHLDEQIEKKKAEIDAYVRGEEEKIEHEKNRLSETLERIKKEENNRIQERLAAKQELKINHEKPLQEIRERIERSSQQLALDLKKVEEIYAPEISKIISGNHDLVEQEIQITQSMEDLQEKFNSKKFDDEQKLRKQEETYLLNIAKMENTIKDKEEKINEFKSNVGIEVAQFIENFKKQESKLKSVIQDKEKLLVEEREYIDAVIEKQQKIYEKLAEKKKASIEEENKRNNRILEKEIRRLEKEKEEAGERFSLTMEELDKSVREKEERYENLLNEQLTKNKAYLDEYQNSLKVQAKQNEDEDVIEEKAYTQIREQLLQSEKATSYFASQQLSATKNNYIDDIYKLQEGNNSIIQRIGELRKQYEDLTTAYRNNDADLRFSELFNSFEKTLKDRKNRLHILEEEENELRKQKANKIASQTQENETIVDAHHARISELEDEIEKEQNRLTEFENQMSERRRLEKEKEIENKNLFRKKLNYLKQKMFDN